jgi:hypothetical protein
VVLVAGETVTLLPVKAPGFQVYVDAPVAVKVAELPIQMELDEAAGVIVGIGLTTTATIVVVVQPNALLPVTE